MTTSTLEATATVENDLSTGVRTIVRRYVAMLAVLTAVVAVAPAVVPAAHAPPRPRIGLDWVFGNWLQWDAWWYVAIAMHGYTYRPGHMSAVAFFPVYPLLVRALAFVLPGGVPVAALLVTTACGLGALLLFHRWCARRMSSRAALLAVGALAFYPYAWFLYGTAYSDALFLVFVLGAFLALEADRTVVSGLLGALATATRPTGIVIVIGLVAVAADRRGLLGGGGPRSKLRRADAAVLLSVAGIALWCVWLAIRFGNPFAFVETEGARGWNQAPGMHTWLKVAFFDHVRRAPTVAWVPLAVQAVMCVMFIAAAPFVARRFGRGYGVYVLATAVVPAISTADFMGVGRYLLPAFPVFALVGAALERRRLTRVVASGVSAAVLVTGTALFASGYYLT
jgi:Gpi18-like mannosyltransferase